MVKYIPNVIMNILTNSLKKGDFIRYISTLLLWKNLTKAIFQANHLLLIAHTSNTAKCL